MTSNGTVSAVINGGVVVLYFKSCLRCKDGTVELGSDNFGSFLSCITCGYTINSRSIRANGSIEQPTSLEEDVVMAPPVEQIAALEEVDEPGFDPDIDLFYKDAAAIEVEDLELEEALI
ncbi:MAG TPA: hypothetical protein DHV68_01780 [Dehalococcoidia bacterium]|nr:hypothetical protein [Dehalococcoidia bacterium]